MKKAEGNSPKSEGRRPGHQGVTSRPASSFILHPSSLTRIPWWLLAVLLVLVTMALYWPATRCDFIVIDDAFNVTGNIPVRKGLTWEGIKVFFFNPWAPPGWTPITMLSHMVVVQVCGLNPGGHHLGNVLVHAFNAALVFAWLRLMTGATWRSLLVAALFAVHPLRVEPVLWVTERRELVCAFFGLLTLMAYVRYAKGSGEKAESRKQKAESGSRKQEVRGRWSFSHLSASFFYVLSVGLYACGLLSKPTIVTWPFVMLLLDYWPLKRMQNAAAGDTLHATRSTPPVSRFTFHALRSTLLPLLVEKIPFFVGMAIICAMASVGHELSRSFTWGGNHPLGARLGNAVYSYGWYLGELFWPTDLAVIYLHPGYWPLEKVLLAGGLILGISVLVGVGWRRYPYLLVGWLWYCGTLVPNSQLLQTGVLPRADRWTYVPLLGFLILIVWGAGELFRGKDEGRRMKDEGRRKEEPEAAQFHPSSFILHPSLLWVACGVAIILYSAMTRQQIGYWKDSETLLRHSLAVTGSGEVPLTFLGTALGQKGQPDEAIRQFQAALRLNPDFAPAHNELATTLGQKGQLDEAIRQFQEAIRIEPGYTLVHFNLGNAFLEKGQTDDAIREYREALRRKLRMSLGDPNLHNNLGLALARKGQTDEAIDQYQEALRLAPDDPDIHYNLGLALGGKGQIDEAIRQLQEALRLKPDYAAARKNLDAALAAKVGSSPPPAATNR
jgi:protein O-mannosyl-transferase